MDLTILFSPLEESVYSDITSPSSFYKNIRIFGDKMPGYKDAHIAIFGIKEARGTSVNPGAAHGPDEIRKKLYNLKKEMAATALLTWEI
jgi:formiminoglutamase